METDYYRLAEVYFDYGLFLKIRRVKIHEALDAHRKALEYLFEKLR